MFVLVLPGALGAQDSTARPVFENFSVPDIFIGKAAEPILRTAEQRNYRTRIREGVRTGRGVWSHGVNGRTPATGPNFAGHYFLIAWGCGSQCAMMAIVDAVTGTITEPPLARKSELYVPLDNQSQMEIDFRPDSRLLILRDACRDFRARRTCGTYFFDFKDDQFTLVKFAAGKPVE